MKTQFSQLIHKEAPGHMIYDNKYPSQTEHRKGTSHEIIGIQHDTVCFYIQYSGGF